MINIPSYAGYSSTAQPAARQARTERVDALSPQSVGELNAYGNGGSSESAAGSGNATEPSGSGLRSLFQALRAQLALGQSPSSVPSSVQESERASTPRSASGSAQRTSQFATVQIFNAIDANTDGRIDPIEFNDFLSAHAVQPRETRGGGELSRQFEQLVAAYRSTAQPAADNNTTQATALSVAV